MTCLYTFINTTHFSILWPVVGVATHTYTHTHTHTFLPVLKLLCILQVDGMELDGLVVVLHECERVSQTVARLRNKCRVIYFTCHCHRCAVVTRTAVITNDPYQVYIHTMYRICIGGMYWLKGVLTCSIVQLGCTFQEKRMHFRGCWVLSFWLHNHSGLLLCSAAKIVWERGNMCGW